MNRMQKLGIDPSTVEGLTRLFKLQCEDIKDGHSGSKVKCKYPDSLLCCHKCKAERLLEEIPTKKVKRWETIKSDEDLKKIVNEWMRNGYECEACGYTGGKDLKDCIRCLQNYLCEEIEVEDEVHKEL